MFCLILNSKLVLQIIGLNGKRSFRNLTNLLVMSCWIKLTIILNLQKKISQRQWYSRFREMF